MTTAQRPRQQVLIAGVPWPAYKLVALAIGLVTLLGVALTAGAATGVLSAAATCTAVWLALGPLHPSGRQPS